MGDARGQGVDIAVGAVEPPHHARDPVLGQSAVVAHQVPIDAPQQMNVGAGHELAVVGNPAHLPQQPHGVGARG